MSTVAPYTSAPQKRVAKSVWSGVVEATTAGDAVSFARYDKVTVEVVGTFGGASVQMKGSNDGSNYQTMTTEGSQPMTFTAEGVKIAYEAPLFLKPVIANGSGPTSLTVTAVARAQP